MPRCRFAIVFALCASIGGGCHSGGNSAVVIPASHEQPAARTIPVSFVDARPKWQTTHYRGARTLHRYADAIRFVPMEACEPSFQKALTAEVQRRLDVLPKRPSRVDVRIVSFQLVDDRTANQWARFDSGRSRKAERERERRESENRWRQSGLATSGKPTESSFGSAVANAFFELVLQVWFESVVESAKEIAASELLMGRPPVQIRDKFHPGITCHVEIAVAVHWDESQPLETRLNGIGRQPPVRAEFTTAELAQPVAGAIQHIGGELVRACRTHLKP